MMVRMLILYYGSPEKLKISDYADDANCRIKFETRRVSQKSAFEILYFTTTTIYI